jgi:polysaccharide pyruvyl transferase WcaK-like protein
MPSVLLAGLCASDPAGNRAVTEVIDGGLPGHEIVRADRAQSAESLLREARRCAAVVMAGTAIGSTASSLRLAALASAAGHRPLACVGLSVDPVRRASTATLARRALGRAALLLLADEQSAEHLAATGMPLPLRVAADPAWLALTPVPRQGGAGEHVVVVINSRVGWQLERALAAALVTVARAGRQVRLVGWQDPGGDDDEMISRLVLNVLAEVPNGAVKEEAPSSLSEAAARFADAHAVVALRRRAVYAAVAAGVPVVAVPSEPGMASAAWRLGQVTVGRNLTTALPVALERVGNDVPAAAPVGAEMARAEAGVRLLRLLLEPEAVSAADVDHVPLVPVPWL